MADIVDFPVQERKSANPVKVDGEVVKFPVRDNSQPRFEIVVHCPNCNNRRAHRGVMTDHKNNDEKSYIYCCVKCAWYVRESSVIAYFTLKHEEDTNGL